jgi:hypothetical protein
MIRRTGKKMGELVDFAAWKKKREDEAHAKELAEIAELKAEVKRLMDDMGEPETGPYYATEEEKDWMMRMTEIMMTSLSGYKHWPVDSSDL